MSVEDWLRSLEQDRFLSPSGHQVLQAAISNPKLASFASATELAEAAKVNVASVTRAAQSVGYSGWPAWRQEIRARFIGTLTATELADVHKSESATEPFGDALKRQIQQLTDVRRALDRKTLNQFARSIATANRRLIIASGSYTAIGQILAHHATLAGYRSELAEDSVAISNATGDLQAGDVVIAFTFWRIYKSTLTAMREARKRGAKVCLLADAALPQLIGIADHILIVPSESASYFVSVVPAMAVVEGVCAELERIDPARTSASIKSFEKQWRAFDHLHSDKE